MLRHPHRRGRPSAAPKLAVGVERRPQFDGEAAELRIERPLGVFLPRPLRLDQRDFGSYSGLAYEALAV